LRSLFVARGSPDYIRSDNENFDWKLRDELSARELFYTLEEAKVLIEPWRREYNEIRPHSALGDRPPAPAAVPPGSAQKAG